MSPIKIFQLSLIFIILFLSYSCNKDSDLFAEYIINEDIQGLQRYVVDDVVNIEPMESAVIDVLNNDNFERMNNVAILSATGATKGSVSVNEDNTVTYSSETETEVVDTFVYTVEVQEENEEVVTETATVTVNVEEEEPDTQSQNNPVTEVADEVIFYNGFEGGTGDWTDGRPWTNNNGGLNVAISTDAREGSYSAEFTPDDGGKRSELMPVVDSDNVSYKWGVEYWQGFSIKIVEAATGYKIIQQHHATPHNNDYSCSAAANGFTIRDNDGQFEIMTATNQSLTNEHPSSEGAIHGQESVYVDRNLNQWYDFVLHFRYSESSDGFWEVWIDGKKVVNLHNLATVYKYDNCGNLKEPEDYLKIGLYYGNGNEGGKILYDAIKIAQGSGVNYTDVSPLGLGPQ